jgi:hypothetical protein
MKAGNLTTAFAAALALSFTAQAAQPTPGTFAANHWSGGDHPTVAMVNIPSLPERNSSKAELNTDRLSGLVGACLGTRLEARLQLSIAARALDSGESVSTN